MRSKRWGIAVLGVTGAFVVLPATAAVAHPTGDLTVNTATRIEVGPTEVRLVFAMDMAELITSYEMPAIDADDSGDVTDAEASAYAERKAGEYVLQQVLTIDGAAVPLRAEDPRLTLIEGTAGLPYLRLDAIFVGPIPPGEGTLVYANNVYPQADGWREVTAVGVGGRRVVSADVPEDSPTEDLAAYPDDAFENPMRVTQAELDLAEVEGVSPPPSTEPPPAPSPTGPGSESGARPRGIDARFADLVTRGTSPAVVLVSLLLAMGFGALHALAPGHGKSLMAAYLVGSDTKLRQAAGVGVAIALMHTGSVIVLFLIVRSFETVFPGQTVYSWLGLAAGVVAVGLGLWMLRVRLRAWRAARVAAAHDHAGHGHDHEGHDQHDEHDHGHEHGHTHPHAALPPGTSLLSRPGLAALAVAGGLVPAPGALLVLTATVVAGRTLFGLSLVLAFSVGMAAALTAIGTLALGARVWTSRHLAGRLAAIVPLVGASAVIAVGAFLVVRAATQL